MRTWSAILLSLGSRCGARPTRRTSRLLRIRIRIAAGTEGIAAALDGKLTASAAFDGTGETMDMTKGTAYPAGSFFINPANHPHYFWTTDQGVVLQFSIIGPLSMTFVNPADDPRRK